MAHLKKEYPMMKMNIQITGCAPEHWRAALAELRQELGMNVCGEGVQIRCRRGEGIAVVNLLFSLLS